MADAVGQRFLHRAIDARPMTLGQALEVALHVQLDVDAVAMLDVADVPFERRLQPEVVEHAGPQAEREVTNRAKHLVDEPPSLGDGGADARVAHRSWRRSMRPSSMRSAVSTWAT